MWRCSASTRCRPQKVAVYVQVYEMALVIPAVSVSGVLLAAWLRHRSRSRSTPRCGDRRRQLVDPGRGLVFAVFSIAMGLAKIPFNQEIIFTGSMVIVVFLMWRLVRELEPQARATLVGTAVVIFVFRAMPRPGRRDLVDDRRAGLRPAVPRQAVAVPAASRCSALFLFRRFVAVRSIAYVVGFLTVAHAADAAAARHGTTACTNGPRRTPAGWWTSASSRSIDTALDSPLGQVSMVPMLAWIANSAPEKLKATYFAVMASFTNLALSASQLGTKYLNTGVHGDARGEGRRPPARSRCRRTTASWANCSSW